MTLSESLLLYYSVISKYPDRLEPESFVLISKTYADVVRAFASAGIETSRVQIKKALSQMQEDRLIELKRDRWKPRSPYATKSKDQVERELVLSR